jgi:3'-phosphoadenosine 5'-phosphosulfate sulfotransferase (PAPS reductase)/FAD synthetase
MSVFTDFESSMTNQQKMNYLKQRQSLPLEVKIKMTEQRIKQFNDFFKGNVYVAFSGGKDSTVLLDIARKVCPGITAVFSDTGLEFPEIREFVKTFDNVEIVRPKKSFLQVINEYGYPVISKKVSRFVSDLRNPTEKNEATRNLRLTGFNSEGKYQPSMKLSKKWLKLVDAPFKVSNKCCDYLKKQPLQNYSKKTNQKPIIAVMTCESEMREKQYLQHGCNIYKGKSAQSQPMAFWTEQDVLEYLSKNSVKYASVYGEIKIDENGKYYTTGERRTGCVFCMYGCHLEKGLNRFQRLKSTHPQLYDYCINKLKIGEVLDYIGVKYE